MAANLYPQGITLRTIGYAALKYPELPEDLPIPLSNQVGALQRLPLGTQARIMPHIASQYLPTLLIYQYSPEPSLADPLSPQHYSSTSFILLNYISSNADAATIIAKHPTLFDDTVTKLLIPSIVEDVKAARDREDKTLPGYVGTTSWESDFGNLLQFISTMLLRREHLPLHAQENLPQLLEKLKSWKTKYKNKFMGRVSERLIEQIEDPASPVFIMVRESQNESLVCGWVGCSVKTGLTACGRCKLQRYCGMECQRRDWGFHKRICGKGLVEEGF